jgi:hypothetical protein
LQSKKFCPTPLVCVVWQPPLQQPGVAHSQPSVSGAVPALQSLRPLLQLYLQLLPLQVGCPVLLLQARPQAPQLEVELSGVSQLAKPEAQPVYVHDDPPQAAPVL